MEFVYNAKWASSLLSCFHKENTMTCIYSAAIVLSVGTFHTEYTVRVQAVVELLGFSCVNAGTKASVYESWKWLVLQARVCPAALWYQSMLSACCHNREDYHSTHNCHCTLPLKTQKKDDHVTISDFSDMSMWSLPLNCKQKHEVWQTVFLQWMMQKASFVWSIATTGMLGLRLTAVHDRGWK